MAQNSGVKPLRRQASRGWCTTMARSLSTRKSIEAPNTSNASIPVAQFSVVLTTMPGYRNPSGVTSPASHSVGVPVQPV